MLSFYSNFSELLLSLLLLLLFLLLLLLYCLKFYFILKIGKYSVLVYDHGFAEHFVI